MSLFENHKTIIETAVKANSVRGFFAQYPEHPSPKVYGETADSDGRKKFMSGMGKPFEGLLQLESSDWKGEEESPYLQEQLGITYPAYSPEQLINEAEKGFHNWRKVSVEDRAGILVESLERLKNRFFEIAYATMHTTGQGYMMAFQASGPHAADRALEAIAMGYQELGRFPKNVLWDKPMGKFNITLKKEWRAIAKGVSVVIGCSTFPTWNSVPGIYASLITGNSVIVKPHHGAILPIAIFVAEIQKVLKEQGHSPSICQLAIDTPNAMITKELAEDPKTKIIDYTGNSQFGNYLEKIEGKTVFTEKTGVNSVIIESAENIDKVAGNLAFSLALYSGQMCTAPQNIFVPAGGIDTPEGTVSFDQFAEKFVANVRGIMENPKAGPFVLGAIQNPKTCERINDLSGMGGKFWLETDTIENPMFANARIMTPAVVELSSADVDKFSAEMFGPIALLIKVKDVKEATQLAKELAIKHGAISCGAYTTDAEMKEHIADEMSLAATPVSFNLTGGIYLNQHAAFSDFHVTGGNPAGNASFTNADYINRRFTWVGMREPA